MKELEQFFSKNYVYDVALLEMRQMSKLMALCCAHTHYYYFDLNWKSLAQKRTEKIRFCKTHVGLHQHL